MIPLTADVPSGSVPFATMGLIAPNVLLFLATIFTSMFLHRGLFHVAGTMLYPCASVLILVIFGFFVRIVRWPAMIVLRLVDRDPVHQRAHHGQGLSRGRRGDGGTAWFAHIGGAWRGSFCCF